MTVSFWHWWALGLLLVVIEMVAPGTHFVWMGGAAFAIGGLLLLWPSAPLEIQILLFAVLSVAAIVAWRLYSRRRPAQTDQPALNRRGAQYLGQTFVLSEPITNGSGRIRIGDTTWKASGPDAAAGAAVRVVGVDGVVLRVERVHAPG